MGASLLAMASGQSAALLTDTPLSRAGSLPQGMYLQFHNGAVSVRQPRFGALLPARGGQW
ncbi:hypothetical protein DZG01_06250 [Pseudomonas fluorescens]|nr:hypothetical protein DZG01_06250 [Pseudomonas fluorescens]